MVRLNKIVRAFTRQGARAIRFTPEMELKRALMNCLLWESHFYEDGVSIAGRIKALVPKVAPARVAQLAIEAREVMKLRHAPLLVIREMARDRILPYRFITAARYAPDFEPELEGAMLKSVKDHVRLPGRTRLLIDVSGSMFAALSAQSEMTRAEAACGLAILAREICDEVEIFTFSDKVVKVPPRRGFALRDAIINSQAHSGTWLGKAVAEIDRKGDRLIVFTDEQSHDRVPEPKARGTMVNVASYQHGVGYGAWTRVSGFSEAVVAWIAASETALN